MTAHLHSTSIEKLQRLLKAYQDHSARIISALDILKNHGEIMYEVHMGTNNPNCHHIKAVNASLTKAYTSAQERWNEYNTGSPGHHEKAEVLALIGENLVVIYPEDAVCVALTEDSDSVLTTDNFSVNYRMILLPDYSGIFPVSVNLPCWHAKEITPPRKKFAET